MYFSKNKLLVIFSSLLVTTVAFADQNSKRSAIYNMVKKIELLHGSLFELTEKVDESSKKERKENEETLKEAIRNFPLSLKLNRSDARKYEAFPYVYYVKTLEKQLKRLRKKQITVAKINKRAKNSLKKARNKKQKEIYQNNITENDTLENVLAKLCKKISEVIAIIVSIKFYHKENRFHQMSMTGKTTNNIAKFLLFGPLGLLF